jgi:hypothetical protein
MFKENDNMRPGPTPERVLAICRLLEGNTYDQTELYKLSQLSDEGTSEEAVNHSIQAAKELALIKEENGKYVNIDGGVNADFVLAEDKMIDRDFIKNNIKNYKK